MGDYYDPSANGGYLGKPQADEASKPKSKTDNLNKGTIEGCGCVTALFIVCMTIIILAMIFTGYHF